MKEEDCEHYYCGDCKHFNNCPRTDIDHVKIKFYKPFFKTYDRHQYSGIPCCKFEPNDINVYGKSVWKNFDDYWEQYVNIWLPYHDINTTVAFVLNDDFDVWYEVPLKDWVFGSILDKNGKLKAIEKDYYKQVRSGFGYKLVREKIEGADING